MKVPPGVSGRAAQYDGNVDQTALANELELLTLGPFEPLNIWIDLGKYLQEVEMVETAVATLDAPPV